MAREFAKKFYKSKAWQKCRDAYFDSKFGLCERCQGAGLIVHHKEALTPLNINDPNVTLDWEKIELLCQDCHNKETFGSDATADGLTFDAEGNLLQR